MEVHSLKNTILKDLMEHIKHGANDIVIIGLIIIIITIIITIILSRVFKAKKSNVFDNKPNIKTQENMNTLAKTAVKPGIKDIFITLKGHEHKVMDALNIIVRSENKDLIDLLLNQVTNEETKKYIINEALYIAVEENKEDMITFILERGAKIDTNQRQGNTPLHIAIIAKCDVNVIEHLIKNGAQIKFRNKKTKTALDLVNNILDNSESDPEEKEKFEKIKKILINKYYECLTGGLSVLKGFSYQIKYLTLYVIINTKLAISQGSKYELKTEPTNLVPFDDIHLRRTQGGRTRCEFVQVKKGKVEPWNFFSIFRNDKKIKEHIKGNDSIVQMFIKYNEIVNIHEYNNTTKEFMYCMNGKFVNIPRTCFNHISMVDNGLLCGVKRDQWLIDPNYLFIEIKYVMLNLIATSLDLTKMTKTFNNELYEQITKVDNLIKDNIIDIEIEDLWSVQSIANKGLNGIREYLTQYETSRKDSIKKENAMRLQTEKNIFLFFVKYNEKEIKSKIRNFVKQFHIFSNCPSDGELDDVIAKEIKEVFKFEIPKLSKSFFINEVYDWMSNYKTEINNKIGKLPLFTESDGKILFNDIRIEIFNAFNKPYIEELRRSNIHFEQTNEEVRRVKDFLNSQNKVLHIITNNTRLHIIDVMQTLESLPNLDKRNIYCAKLSDILKSVDYYKNCFDGFSTNDSNKILVLEYADSINQNQQVSLILNSINDFITIGARTKLIIIGEKAENELITEINGITSHYTSFNSTLSFNDLTPESQIIILNNTIYFRNNPNSLKTYMLLRDFLTMSTAFEVIDENMLSSIVTNVEGIQIGNERAFRHDEYNPELYIPRQISNDNIELESLRHGVRKNETCNIDKLVKQNIKDKVVIVANNAGEGKSTMLTHLAHDMRNESQNLWIIRVDLRNCTDDKLPDSLNSITYSHNDTTNAIEHLTCMLVNINVINTLEKKVLQAVLKKCHRIAVVLLIDGFDEISPDYKEKACIMLKALAKSDVKQLWVTTRVHLKEYLENELQVKAHTLVSLTEPEQIQFLWKFWKFHLREAREDENNLEILKQRRILMHNYEYITGYDSTEYTDKYIKWNKLSVQNFIDDERTLKSLAERCLDLCKSPKKNDDFLKIPLHLEILATNLIQREWKIIHSKNLHLFEMYKEFIENKFEIYCERSETRRGNLNAKELAKIAVIPLMKMHREIAVTTLFEHSFDSPGRRPALPDLSIRSEYSDTLEMLLRVGLVKRYGNNNEFVHRTFAEYFFSEYLDMHLEHPEVQSTFLMNILVYPDYYLVRKFFDRFLFKRRVLLQTENKNRENILVNNVRKAIVNYDLHNYENVLHIAVREGHVEIFLLIFNNISKKVFLKLIMQKYLDEYSILHLLCISDNHIEMLNTLVDSIKELNIKYPFHNFNSSLSSLVNYGKQHSVLRYLLLQCDSFEQTVLHMSALHGLCDMTEIIINSAKSCSILEKLIKKRDKRGKTALHYAVRSDLYIVHVILNSIEDDSELYNDIILQKDKDGKTASDLALWRSNLLILKTAKNSTKY